MRTRIGLAIMAGFLILATTCNAGELTFVPEVRTFAGAYIPTGNMRDVLKEGPMVGAQLGVEIVQQVHAVASVGWSFTTDRALAVDEDLHIAQYDVGLEVFETFDMSEAWMLRPFLGLGAGGRSYHYNDLDRSAETDFAGYLALGTEFQIHRMALRVEGRDYLSRFEGLDGTRDAETRNDLFVSAGIAYHLK
jgi:hypothetical protein